MLLRILLLLICTGVTIGCQKKSPDGSAGQDAQIGARRLVRTTQAPPDFGERVLVFDPQMDMSDIQARIDAVYGRQEDDQFGDGRYAILFKPGEYELDVKLGFYMHVAGLGLLPDDVHIRGGLRSTADWFKNNATHNFWRAAENVSVTPIKHPTNLWAVSQAAPLRRVHIRGSLSLSQKGGWSSGGYLADSLIDGSIQSGSQQQWFTRNTELGDWEGGVWNHVFLGVENAPSGTWPERPYTVIDSTPVVREKPFLVLDRSEYSVFVPGLRENGRGTSWQSGMPVGKTIPIGRFHIARPETDTAATLNHALEKGQHLLLTPGIYELDDTIRIEKEGTVVLGLGLATLRPVSGLPAMAIADVSGVSIAGLLFDAGPVSSNTLLLVGPEDSERDHSANPTFLHDVFCRVGGAAIGVADSCVTINSNDVVGDHFWLWRADHGTATEWHENRSANGLIVNGDRAKIYGLMVEHFQEYQTLWNGNAGKVYFYQSEMPYDPPSQSKWQHGDVKGYASYKVHDSVTEHQAFGLGVYCVFQDAPIVAYNAFESPTRDGVVFRHLVTIWLNGVDGSGIGSILNGTGDGVSKSNRRASLE